MTNLPDSGDDAGPRWQPLPPMERRVVGVLVEKAKTTPENYPLSLNAIRTGANQKSNRFPLMQLDNDHVEEALDRLRELGAVTEIVGDSRVTKFRHRMYDWMGVEKVELAVMAELLLRGAQTVGELRGRSARMEPIRDLSALEPILNSLLHKGLVQYLAPPGRGATVTHCLYLPKEQDKLLAEHGVGAPTRQSAPRPAAWQSAAAGPDASPAAGPQETRTPAPQQPPTPAQDDSVEIAALRNQLAQQRAQIEQLQTETDALRRELDDVKSQLGI